jgi:hypothetical protein
MENRQQKRWSREREISQKTGIPVSTLQKDRVTEQRFPFHKVGRAVYYDLNEVNAAIEAARFGGKQRA